MSTTPNDLEERLAPIRTALGARLLHFILDIESEAVPTRLSEGQQQVMETLTVWQEQRGVTDEQARITVLQALVSQLDEVGLTVAERLRSSVRGETTRSENSADDIPSVLGTMAGDLYPLLLLPPDNQRPGWTDPMNIQVLSAGHRHPLNETFLALAHEDEAFRALQEDGGLKALYRSTGSGGSIQLETLPSTVMSTTWDQRQPIQTREDFVGAVSEQLSVVTSVLLGKTVTIPARVGLTGILLPDDQVVSFGVGTLRPATEVDHASAPPSIAGKLESRDPDGIKLLMSYDGDVVLETQVPFNARVGSMGGGEDMGSLNSLRDLENIIALVRQALVLAVAREPRVQAFPTYRAYDDPFNRGRSMSWQDPRQFVGSPARLTSEEVAEWVKWIDLVSSPRAVALELAITRLLRASSERTDAADVLIDAVIAWESVFGASPESTIRVTAAIGHLLEPDPQQRVELVKELKAIYTLRSKVVHGTKTVGAADVPQCLRALEIGVKVVKALLETRPELLDVGDSSARSNYVLVHGLHTEAATDEWAGGRADSETSPPS